MVVGPMTFEFPRLVLAVLRCDALFSAGTERIALCPFIDIVSCISVVDVFTVYRLPSFQPRQLMDDNKGESTRCLNKPLNIPQVMI